jgi:hypothetical protein
MEQIIQDNTIICHLTTYFSLFSFYRALEFSHNQKWHKTFMCNKVWREVGMQKMHEHIKPGQTHSCIVQNTTMINLQSMLVSSTAV